MGKPFNISVLISGGGTTLKNLIDVSNAGRLNADIALTVSSNPKAGGNSFAIENNIPLVTMERKLFSSDEEYSDAVFAKIRDAKTDLVVMGGFLKRLLIPADFENRVINIHPSLIPAFAGKGFYGNKVHQAVIDHGCKLTGCTVHFVDNVYDNGPIITQRPVDVLPDDSAAVLQQRVFEVECQIYPQVVNAIAGGNLSVHNRVVKGFAG